VADQTLRYRLGSGLGGDTVEDGIVWGAQHGFHFTDFKADYGPDALAAWPEERVRRFRQLCEQHDMHVGLHTLSAVNVAEFSPHVSEGVDAYLNAYTDLAHRLGAMHVIVHAGLHQSAEVDMREKASLERLQRATAYAETQGVTLLLENLNFEPDDAEVHYMGMSAPELQRYFGAIQSPNLKWGFSANHAHLLPGDFDSFIDALGVDRIGLVLIADCRGAIEEHLPPGQGTLDFGRLFRRLEGDGYRGPYSMTFGNRAEKLAAREYLLEKAGIA